MTKCVPSLSHDHSVRAPHDGDCFGCRSCVSRTGSENMRKYRVSCVTYGNARRNSAALLLCNACECVRKSELLVVAELIAQDCAAARGQHALLFGVHRTSRSIAHRTSQPHLQSSFSIRRASAIVTANGKEHICRSAWRPVRMRLDIVLSGFQICGLARRRERARGTQCLHVCMAQHCVYVIRQFARA